MSEQTAPPQPTEGQEQQSQEGLYPDLSAVPQDVREIVTPLLKQMEGNITRKFTEAADFRKQWEPYQELGLHDLEMDELKDLLAFREIAADEKRFREWHQAVGSELGPQEQAPEVTPDTLQEQIAQALNERLSPIEQTFRQQAEAQRIQDAEAFITESLGKLQEEHGEFDHDAVCQLALAYEGQDAIDRGFADYQRLIGAAEKNFLNGKLSTPETPEQGGRPPTQVQPITSFADAKAAALERVRQAQST